MKKTLLFALSFILLFASCAGAKNPVSADFLQEEPAVPELFSEPVSVESADPEEDLFISFSIAASGNLVWRIAGTEIVCADASVRQDTASLSIDELLESEAGSLFPDRMYGLRYLSLAARDENCVWLCAALTDEDAVSRILLFSLILSENRITVSSVTDAGFLSPFLSADSDWLEIDITGCGNETLLIAALDQEHTFHLFCCRPAEETLTDLGTESLMLCQAAVPYGSDILLAGFSLNEDNALDLTLLPLSGDERTLLTTVEIDSEPFNTANFAWSQNENRLYYTLRNSAYRVSPGTGEPPVPFAVTNQAPVLNRLGVIAGGAYILYAEDGSLIYNDLHAELTASRIRIADATGNETLPDLAAGYNGIQNDYYVTVSAYDGETLVPDPSDDTDIYVVSTDSDAWNILKSRDSFTNLAASETLRSAVADMPESIRALVCDGERLAGLPISAENNCLVLNVPVIQALTGLPREEIPTDWPGFLRLLNQLSGSGILAENPQYTVFDSVYSAGELKEILFAWIMNDCLLRSESGSASIDSLPETLLPALQEFSSVAWDNLGLPEEESPDPDMEQDDEQIPLLTVVQPEIAVMAMEDGMEYWPLSADGTGERLISQTICVLVVNPGSSRAAGTLAFTEYAWNNLDILAKMGLCQSMNEPVENPSYEEDIAYLEQLASSYRTGIAGTDTKEEAALLQQELDDLESFIGQYRENAVWLASEASIAEYRALSAQMVPAPTVPEFLNETDAVQQFLASIISADQFAATLKLYLAGND